MRVIAVTSGKGGVGKTNFTVNLALALIEHKVRVAVLDGDLGLSNVDIACGVVPRYTIQHLITGEKTVEEVVVQGPKGMLIVPGGSGILELANLDRVSRLSFIANIGRLEDMADILIIDTGAGLGNTVIDLLRASDDVIVITTPEPTAITDAYGMLKVLYANGVSCPAYVVVNKVHSEAEARLTYERLEKAVQKFLQGSIRLMGWVYEDRAVSRAVMMQVPLGVAFPQSSSYQCIRWIAGSVLGLYVSPPRQAGGVRGFLKGLLDM